MFCNQCGAPMVEGQLTCTACGAYVGSQPAADNQQNQYQQNQYQQNQYQQNQYQQPQYQQPQYQQNQYQQNQYHPNQYQAACPQLGMNWFKFVIWVQLFITTITGVFNGYQIFTGAHYKLSDMRLEMLYDMYEGLQGIDSVIGISFMCLGAFALVTRFALAGFKKVGPVMYISLLAMVIVLNVIYVIAVDAIVDNIQVTDSSIIVSIVIYVALLICNIIYFRKRKHLFVN